jgi:hypothetical protein
MSEINKSTNQRPDIKITSNVQVYKICAVNFIFWTALVFGISAKSIAYVNVQKLLLMLTRRLEYSLSLYYA